MKLIDSNRYYLPGTENRFIHYASVHYGLKEFMCFADKSTGQVYIEEISGGHLAFIDDDALAQGLRDFLTDRGVLDLNRPMLSDDEWLRQRKNT